jgi:DNA-binding XRE family transcriptional regulator/deoxycytidylate deaminase
MRFGSFIDKLTQVALKSNMKIKLAAGIFYSKKGFIATGCNTTRTYSKNSNPTTSIQPSEHAECAALRELRKFPNINTKDLKLFVIRISSTGELLQSTPCMNCADRILKNGIKKIYYINEEQKIVCQHTSDLCKIHKECPYRNITMTNIWFEHVSCTHGTFSKTLKSLEEKEKVTPCFTIEMGEKIAMLRNIRQLTQKELALQLSLPIQSIIQIEQGKEQFNSLLFSKLVRCFGNVI